MTNLNESGDRPSEGTHKVVNAPVETRPGVFGRPVLIVLAAVLVLAAVVWIVTGRSTVNDAVTESGQGVVVEPGTTPAEQPVTGTQAEPATGAQPATGTEAQPAEEPEQDSATGTGTQGNDQSVAPE